MGIKHFFAWYRKNFESTYIKIKNDEKIENLKVDNLLLDLNGIFHSSCQEVYKYGAFAQEKRLLAVKQKGNEDKQTLVFENICKRIENIMDIIGPTKRVIMCVDGPGPIGKQNQQRQRRFRNEPGEMSFDSNCITPGTKFMNELSKYLKNYIKNDLKRNANWQHLEIHFSSEKVPGEGEHKAVEFVRNNKDESYCINGPDADLFMLTLSTHVKNFYILRDDMYNNGSFFLINIRKTRSELINMLEWVSDKNECDAKSIINDFIFMCFVLGNDFVPNIPSVEIISNGIEMMIQIYRVNCAIYGHLTETNKKGCIFINKDSFMHFLALIGENEKTNIESKYRDTRNRFFPDALIDKNIDITSEKVSIDLQKYITDYSEKAFGNDNIEKVCHKYIESLQWVLTYYTSGVSSWTWCYEYHYAPFASQLTRYLNTYKRRRHGKTIPSLPLQQLLSVLPPHSSDLIPKPLRTLLLDDTSPIKDFFPKEIQIDLSGKKQEWEGVVILPVVDQALLKKVYSKFINKLSIEDKNLNVHEETVIFE